MIRVLHVIDTGGPGGAETVFLNVSAGVDVSRFSSVCVVSRDGWLADALRARNIQPIILPARGSMNVSYLRSLMRIIRQEKIDLIVGHLYGSAIYCSLAGLLCRTPVVSVLHGQNDIAGRGRFAALKKQLVRRGSHLVVFVSAKLKEEVAGALRLPDRMCRVIPNGVDLARFVTASSGGVREELEIEPDDILVGAVGNIRKPKAYDVLLRAARLLREHSRRYKLVIVGEGDNDLHRDLLALRSKLGLDQAVAFLGLRSDIPRLLHSLDVFVLSSSAEGFSIACVEAMAAGIPVVATRSGGPEEIVEHERSGLLVPTGNAEALAAGIERVVGDAALAQRLTRNARKRVEERFTLRAMIESYEAVFERLVKIRTNTST